VRGNILKEQKRGGQYMGLRNGVDGIVKRKAEQRLNDLGAAKEAEELIAEEVGMEFRDGIVGRKAEKRLSDIHAQEDLRRLEKKSLNVWGKESEVQKEQNRDKTERENLPPQRGGAR
jgi:hypothetical protein